MEVVSGALGMDSMVQENSWKEKNRLQPWGAPILEIWKEEEGLKKWPKQIKQMSHTHTPNIHSVMATVT